MTKDEDRRHSERVAFLRPIMYVSKDSGKFVNAIMLNHCSRGICFQSTPLLTPGEQIHILTEEKVSGAYYDRTGESIVGRVMWCREKAGAHWVGVQYIEDKITIREDDAVVLETPSFDVQRLHE